MKRFHILLITLTILFSCSDENSSSMSNEFPTVSEISNNRVNIGDILTINGDFNINDIYIITFPDEITGKITEINSKYLKVEVPKNTKSGNITLSYNGETKVIGSIEVSEFPIINNLSGNSFTIGDILTISGSGFLIDETYIITFSDNKKGIIKEISTTSLTVEIPENSVSGEIKLTHNNITKVIGSIEIVTNTADTNQRVFVMHTSIDQLAEINIENGEITHIGQNIEYGGNVRGAVIHKTNNEYIGLDLAINNQPTLVRVNLETGNSKNVTLSESGGYKDITIDDNDNIYVMHTSVNKLAKINIESGEITHIGENIEYGGNVRGAIIHKANNEYIGLDLAINNQPTLVRINLETGESKNITLTEGGGYKDIAIDENDNIYVMHTSVNKLAKINIETGEITHIGKDIEYGGNVRGAVIHKNNNEYVGLDLEINNQPTIVRINLKTGEHKNIVLSENGGYKDMAIY